MYLLTAQDEKASQLFNKCARENLNSEEIRFRLYQPGQSTEHFANQLEEIMLPICDSARNMGFREWVYEKQ